MKKRSTITGKELGSIIKKRRRELGISQESLANELGVTYQQVQRYESGANKISVDTLQAIAGILQMPITDFFTGVEPELAVPVSPEELKLLKTYREIKDKEAKTLVNQFVKFAVNKRKN